MQEYICQNCGKTFEVNRKTDFRLYCSLSCASLARNKRLHPLRYDGDWKKINDSTYECRFNEGVCCQTRHCERCGWNPEVAKKRMEEKV